MAIISSLEPGQTAKITGYTQGDSGYRQQLLDQGLTPGSHLTLVRRAPLGDPIQIEIRGNLISLRQAEAALIELELTDG